MDDVTMVKMNFRYERWSKTISDCQSSGLTVTRWCLENGISAKSYYYWLRKIRKKVSDSITSIPTPEAHEIVPVRADSLSTAVSSRPITLHVGSATLEIPDGSRPETIAAVLTALKSIC
jgi:hypothetical protein